MSKKRPNILISIDAVSYNSLNYASRDQASLLADYGLLSGSVSMRYIQEDLLLTLAAPLLPAVRSMPRL